MADPLSRQERNWIRRLVSERVRELEPYRSEEPQRRRCIYCGRWTRRKNPPACNQHADLPAIEKGARVKINSGTKPRCMTCGLAADVSYAPHRDTIPGAAHGGRWICASCLYLEDHPGAARVVRVSRPKVPQEDELFPGAA